MKNIKIEVKDLNTYNAIVTIAKSLGIEVFDEHYGGEKWAIVAFHTYHPTRRVYIQNVMRTSLIDNESELVTLNEFLEALASYYKSTPKSISVKLNSEYTAKVFADKIVVGYQTIPISVITQIVNAHHKLEG